MSVIINEKDLPQELTAEQVVEAAYCSELAEVASKVKRGLPALIECEKDLAPYLYANLRNRLRAVNLRCLYLDGRPRRSDCSDQLLCGRMKKARRSRSEQGRIRTCPGE